MSREWVLDVRESELGGVCLIDGQADGRAGIDRQVDRLGIGVDVADGRRGAVAQRSVIGVVDGATDLDLVALVEAEGRPGAEIVSVPSSPCWWRIAW